MQKALVDTSGIVVNIIEWEEGSQYAPPDGIVIVDIADGAAIGGTYENGNFIPPTPPVPPAGPPSAEQFAALQASVQTLTMQVLMGGVA
jgi:hypothetical protein